MTFEAYARELADPSEQLAVSKLVNLSAIRPEEASALLSVWPEIEASRRQRLIDELIELAEDNVELNFDATFFIALGDADQRVRKSAIRGLWEYEGHDLVDSLLKLLTTDNDAAVRAEAALGLGRFVLQAEFDTLQKDLAERVEQALRETVDDQDEIVEVRGRALESVGARDAEWVHDLIEQASRSPDRRLRLSAVHAMGRSCDPAWLPALFAELESDDAEMRFEATVAVGAMAEEAATPRLLPLLEDDDSEVQEAAIAALGEIGGSQAKVALRELLEGSDDERVREAAVAALAEADFADDPLAFKFQT